MELAALGIGRLPETPADLGGRAPLSLHPTTSPSGPWAVRYDVLELHGLRRRRARRAPRLGLRRGRGRMAIGEARIGSPVTAPRPRGLPGRRRLRRSLSSPPVPNSGMPGPPSVYFMANNWARRSPRRLPGRRALNHPRPRS